MQRIAPPAILLAFGALMLAVSPGAAEPQRVLLAQAVGEPEPLMESKPRQVRPKARPKVRSQARAQMRPQARARPQIRVHSRYPYRRYHSIYPLPYPVEYPGPRAVRHCANHYEIDFRPSGGVVVPRMRCWWAPG